jgi:hypothetical protein
LTTIVERLISGVGDGSNEGGGRRKEKKKRIEN